MLIGYVTVVNFHMCCQCSALISSAMITKKNVLWCYHFAFISTNVDKIILEENTAMEDAWH
jgi:hypothetical protein